MKILLETAKVMKSTKIRMINIHESVKARRLDAQHTSLLSDVGMVKINGFEAVVD